MVFELSNDGLFDNILSQYPLMHQLLSIGFTATFSALTSKTWRLNRVIDNAR